jgi:hypothetical protein
VTRANHEVGTSVASAAVKPAYALVTPGGTATSRATGGERRDQTDETENGGDRRRGEKPLSTNHHRHTSFAGWYASFRFRGFPSPIIGR